MPPHRFLVLALLLCMPHCCHVVFPGDAGFQLRALQGVLIGRSMVLVVMDGSLVALLGQLPRVVLRGPLPFELDPFQLRRGLLVRLLRGSSLLHPLGLRRHGATQGEKVAGRCVLMRSHGGGGEDSEVDKQERLQVLAPGYQLGLGRLGLLDAASLPRVDLPRR